LKYNYKKRRRKMAIQEFLETYKGDVKEVVIGKEGKSIKVGGEKTLPLHKFEGEEGNPARFALEICDTKPKEWPEHLYSYFSDVVDEPVKWANKCVNEYGADLISLYLSSIDTDSFDALKIAENVKNIAESISCPLIVNGIGDKDKDAKVLVEVAKVCSGYNLLLGPVLKENYEEIAKAALESGHSIIAQTPLDINLCKELNVKLVKFFPKEKIVIDPLSSALGYGIEYSFSIMERLKQVAVIHNDEMVKMPIIANIGKECWKTKDAKESKTQGILWEAITALTLILAGANILVMRCPESLKLVRKIIS
jgi:acetyl-CoA decarbonylase/synthase complex subunit delta